MQERNGAHRRCNPAYELSPLHRSLPSKPIDPGTTPMKTFWSPPDVPKPPTLLDTQETSVEQPHFTPCEDEHYQIKSPVDCFRHNGWRTYRLNVFNALKEAGTSTRTLNAFATCGIGHVIFKHRQEPDRYLAVQSSCRHRWCLPCQQARSLRIQKAICTRLDDKRYRLITLTLRHSRDPLTKQVDRLLHSFRQLRQREMWKARTLGGCALLELTLNPDNRTWHPHLHVITHGHYLPLQALKEAWLEITKDSYIVDIRVIHSVDQVARYVAKYASKPASPQLLRDPERLQEAIVHLKGRRLAITFGDWHGKPLLNPPDDNEWEFLDYASNLLDTHGKLTRQPDHLLTWLRTLNDEVIRSEHGPAPPPSTTPAPTP